MKTIPFLSFLYLTAFSMSALAKNNLGMQYFEDAKTYQNALFKKEKQNLLPDISLEYFQGTNNLLNYSIKGYQVGLKIPFLFSGNVSKIKASKVWLLCFNSASALVTELKCSTIKPNDCNMRSKIGL